MTLPTKSPRRARARTTGRSRRRSPDLRPEVLEGRTLLAFDALLTLIDVAGNPLPAVVVQSYSFHSGNSFTPGSTVGTAAKPSFGPLNLTINQSIADAALVADLTSGARLKSATLTVPQGALGNGATAPSLEIDLSKVVVTSYNLQGDGNGPPTVALGLTYGAIQVTADPTIPGGSPGAKITGGYDAETNLPNGSDAIVLPQPASTPVVGLTLGGTAGELPVLDYTFGLTHPAGGKATDSALTLTADASTADPGFLVNLAAGKHIPSAVIHANRQLTSATQREVQTITLTDVVVTQYSTARNLGVAVHRVG